MLRENNNIIKPMNRVAQLIIYIKRKRFYIMKVIYNSVIKPNNTLKSVRNVQQYLNMGESK